MIGVGAVLNFAGLVFPSYGRYHLAILWDGTEVRPPLRLRVSQMAPPGMTPPALPLWLERHLALMRPSNHARQRMAERGITLAEAEAVVQNPHTTYLSLRASRATWGMSTDVPSRSSSHRTIRN